MIRSLHRWPGLIAAILLCIIALTGAALSIFPAYETARAPADSGISIAELADRIQARLPTLEQIRRAPTGKFTAYYLDGDQPVAAVIDPRTGEVIGSADTSALQRFLTNLHRSLFLDDAGRIVVAASAAAMLLLCISGLALLARRAGGWRRLFSQPRGAGESRLHASIARLSVGGLALSCLTALWMTASTFGVLPEGDARMPFPTNVSGDTGARPGGIDILRRIPADQLRALTFPAAGDKTDVFTLKTTTGAGYIDQGTGELLAWSDAGFWARTSDLIAMLHTGQGASVLGLLLGLSALGVPAMGWTGIRLWLKAVRSRKRGSVPAGEADTIVLVGSEGGSTWAFADTLQTSLTAAGAHVHIAPMSDFAPHGWPRARRIILLAATYGDGDAPASARGFLARLARLPQAPAAPVAILGFGDRTFPAYCRFAFEVARAAEAKGWRQFLDIGTVDRQSSQEFADWGRRLSRAIGSAFELHHQPKARATTELTLLSRRDYGADVQAPTAILRFALPRTPLPRRLWNRAFPRFQPGDLLGVVPEGSTVPRYYSLASGSRDGFVEICVRRQPGGLCSSQLTMLEPGDRVRAFLRPNPRFRPQPGRRPVLLIGAGTGIGPLAGFLRGNRPGRSMHLFFGARHPQSDALYAKELTEWRRDGRLADVTHAYSRGPAPTYVQDALRLDAERIARLVAAGAQIMVCGGREMAAGVAAALTDILSGSGLTPAVLKAEGRYVEDIF